MVTERESDSEGRGPTTIDGDSSHSCHVSVGDPFLQYPLLVRLRDYGVYLVYDYSVSHKGADP